nr:dodecenoyl-CoA isomerase [Polyrhizophydium stewartii]
MPELVDVAALDGGIFVITMNNGDNRFTVEFMDALEASLDHIEKTHPAGEPGAVVTVSSHDKIFSNGLRLELGRKMGHAYFVRYQRLLSRLLTFRLPTVAALTGHAFAGGLMFALAHDYRVMRSDRGFLCFNEVDMPSPFSPGMTALIAAKVPHPTVFRNLILQAHRYAADEALSCGLVDEKAPSAKETLDAAIKLARRWSDKGRAGVVYTYLKGEMYRAANEELLSARLGFVKNVGIKEDPAMLKPRL